MGQTVVRINNEATEPSEIGMISMASVLLPPLLLNIYDERSIGWSGRRSQGWWRIGQGRSMCRRPSHDRQHLKKVLG